MCSCLNLFLILTLKGVCPHTSYTDLARARALLPNRWCRRAAQQRVRMWLIYKRPQRRRRLICTQDIYDARPLLLHSAALFEKGRRRRHTYLHLVAEEKTPGGCVWLDNKRAKWANFPCFFFCFFMMFGVGAINAEFWWRPLGYESKFLSLGWRFCIFPIYWSIISRRELQLCCIGIIEKINLFLDHPAWVGQSINEKSELKYSSCLCKKGQFIMLRLNFLPDLRMEKEIFHLSNFTLEAVIVNQLRPWTMNIYI